MLQLSAATAPIKIDKSINGSIYWHFSKNGGLTTCYIDWRTAEWPKIMCLPNVEMLDCCPTSVPGNIRHTPHWLTDWLTGWIIQFRHLNVFALMNLSLSLSIVCHCHSFYLFISFEFLRLRFIYFLKEKFA